MKKLMRCFFLIFVLFGWGKTLYPQNPAMPVYELKPIQESVLSVSGLGLTVFGFLNGRSVEPLSDQVLQTAVPADIMRIDRYAVLRWSPQAAHLSDWGFAIGAMAPLSLFLAKPGQAGALPILVMGAEGLMWTAGLTLGTKSIFRRARPFTYNNLAPWEAKKDPDARASFFSGHSSFTAFGAFFTAKVFHDLLPESKWRPVVWGAAAGLTATTAWLRMRAGKHFLSDVLAGAAVGAGIGILIPVMHKQAWPSLELSVVPTGRGVAMGLRF